MTLLLVIVYLTFIGLGLPDSLLGAAWPVMRLDIGAEVSAAGAISLVVCGGTVVSSLASNRLIHRFGTGKVTLASVLATAGALFGMACSHSFAHLCLLAVPLGLGAGSIDAALNNFVATHYKASHMNWLHCFWGIGATAGPVLMSLFMRASPGWRGGYLTVSAMLFCLTFILFSSMSLWKKIEERNAAAGRRGDSGGTPLVTNAQALHVPGIRYALIAFLCYCGCELSAGLWAASYLVETKRLTSAAAATWASLYYGGITAGRFISGFAAMRLSGPRLIRLGCSISLSGVILLLLPAPAVCSLIGFILIGLGCAPFYPAMIHETPARFGEKNSQAAMGLQMASAYIGSTFLPPLAGLLSKRFTLAILPWFLFALTAGMFFSSEKIGQKKSKNQKPRE